MGGGPGCVNLRLHTGVDEPERLENADRISDDTEDPVARSMTSPAST
jgi:hypothetical protein